MITSYECFVPVIMGPGSSKRIGITLRAKGFKKAYVIFDKGMMDFGISGPISFVYFNAATILSFDINGGLIQALVRFVILFLGTFVFIKVEHWLIHVAAPKKNAK